MLTPINKQSGFTLVELLIAAFLGVIIVGSLIYLITNQRRHFIAQQARAESQESAARLHGELLDRIRMAGYMIPRDLPPVVPYYVSDGPDSIKLTANYDNFVDKSFFALSGSTTTVVTKFDDRFRYRPGISLMVRKPGNEPIVTSWSPVDTAIVFSLSGNKYIWFKLAHSLGKNFPVGSRVNTFNSYVYKVVSDTTGIYSCIFRVNNENKEYVLVNGIEDIRLTYETKSDTVDRNTLPSDSLREIYIVNLEISARSLTPDYHYTHPDKGDNYRREKLESHVVVMNMVIKER